MGQGREYSLGNDIRCAPPPASTGTVTNPSVLSEYNRLIERRKNAEKAAEIFVDTQDPNVGHSFCLVSRHCPLTPLCSAPSPLLPSPPPPLHASLLVVTAEGIPVQPPEGRQHSHQLHLHPVGRPHQGQGPASVQPVGWTVSGGGGEEGLRDNALPSTELLQDSPRQEDCG